MLISKFERFITFLKNKNILITTHNLADIDGFVSVITLKYFLEEFHKNQKIFTYFSKLSKTTKEFMKSFIKAITTHKLMINV